MKLRSFLLYTGVTLLVLFVSISIFVYFFFDLDDDGSKQDVFKTTNCDAMQLRLERRVQDGGFDAGMRSSFPLYFSNKEGEKEISPLQVGRGFRSSRGIVITDGKKKEISYELLRSTEFHADGTSSQDKTSEKALLWVSSGQFTEGQYEQIAECMQRNTTEFQKGFGQNEFGIYYVRQNIVETSI